ncbi:MAG: response regulator [Bacteroidales bacterium]
MEKNKKFTVLYVDDEVSNLNIFRNTFRREYNVLTASSAAEGLNILRDKNVDLILTDQRMPEMDGVSFLKETIGQFPELNRILITGYTDFDALKSAINEAKIFQYIQKPWREEQLRNIINKALEIYVLRQENEDLNNQLKEKNQQLEAINEDLLEFDKLKMDFLSIISHEIRTPLNGISCSVDLMKRDFGDDDSESLVSLINILETSVNRLEKFLLSAERITQLKSQKYPLMREAITPENIIDRVIENNHEKLLNKKIVLEKSISNNPEIFIDIKLITYSLDEILDNAIKQSPEGEKIILKTYNEDGCLVIEIKDQGKGFTDKMLKNAFEAFVSDNKNEQHKGLSLAIIKHIMENHSGSIEVSNKPDGGARVMLRFCLNANNDE